MPAYYNIALSSTTIIIVRAACMTTEAAASGFAYQHMVNIVIMMGAP